MKEQPIVRVALVKPENLSDDELIAAFERANSDGDDAEANSLFAEIRRRQLDI
ncbi:hypothetical protein GCM10009087_40260 [Sphingomonas oligophenolica]|uniref:Uncharacterized protein n=1 Tax=Sphingomonas oligophenolica TaxID=301154 RepID=A0ABU9Y280_9SPHN